MSHAFQIRPSEVLGVPEDASLAELHEAYRTRSKRYHPDAGGDAWAFRILSQSYEILCTARVLGRAEEDARREEAARAASNSATAATTASAEGANPFGRMRPPRAPSEEGQTRAGVRDAAAHPSRLVAADLLLLRFELDGPLGLLIGSPEARNLSCTLSLSWPTPEAAQVDPTEVEPILRGLHLAFDAAREAVPPIGSEVQSGRHHFLGWLSYSSALKADEAFRAFRSALREHGLGVVQTIRDLTVPRSPGA